MEASKKYFNPCFLDGMYRGTIDQASVDVQCPQLLAKCTMKIWNTDLCFGESMMKVHKFNYQKPFNEKDIPMINIFEVTSEQLVTNWHLIPKHYKLHPHPPANVKSTCGYQSSL